MKPLPADLRIDREGRWFADGRPVVHEKIFDLFCRSLVREEGGYLIRIGGQTNPVIVEDAPFLVRGLFVENTEDGLDVIRLALNDGRTIDLEPSSLRAPDGRSVYCAIPGAGMEAKFSKDALQLFGKFLEHDPVSGAYVLEFNGGRFELFTGNS